MRGLPLRLIMFCIVWLSLSHCGSDTVSLLVRVKNLPAGIAALQVNATLDDKRAMQAAEFTDKLDQFAITLPKDAIAQGHLLIEVSGVDNDRCELSRAIVDTTVHSDVRYSEVEVSLVKLPATL